MGSQSMASRLTRGELEMKPFKIIKSDPLFSTPLSIFEIDDSSNLNKKLISESRSWQKEKKSANVSNHGDSWHSPDGLMTRTEPGFAKTCPLSTSSLFVPRSNTPTLSPA